MKAAGKMGIIDNVEEGLTFIDDRNLGDEEYLETIGRFMILLKKVLSKNKQ